MCRHLTFVCTKMNHLKGQFNWSHGGVLQYRARCIKQCESSMMSDDLQAFCSRSFQYSVTQSDLVGLVVVQTGRADQFCSDLPTQQQIRGFSSVWGGVRLRISVQTASLWESRREVSSFRHYNTSNNQTEGTELTLCHLICYLSVCWHLYSIKSFVHLLC